MAHWQLQDAKARFSQLVKAAQSEGPQEITVHGKPAAVLVSAEEYQRLAGPRLSFVEFMRASPLVGADLAIRRSRSTNRRVRL
ncbi:MAG: type II toxin-antitoxin system Phd/YefM family antitoxin [Gammaproteobacteria bacterium]